MIQNAADNECLVPVTEAAEAHGGEKPDRVLADAGYRSEESCSIIDINLGFS
jgi:hypothetical protein